jgi:hypothetical protein
MLVFGCTTEAVAEENQGIAALGVDGLSGSVTVTGDCGVTEIHHRFADLRRAVDGHRASVLHPDRDGDQPARRHRHRGRARHLARLLTPRATAEIAPLIAR